VRAGRSAVEVLTGILAGVVTGLRADRNMRWRDPQLSFSRPIRWLLGLWGPVVLPATASRLVAGRGTYLHRTDTEPFVDVPDADAYPATLAGRGIVVSVAQRRAQLVDAAQRLAAGVGGVVAVESEAALLDEITNLVEQPVAILGEFAAAYLDLPEEILANVMRKHQRYLPVRDASGRLLPYFIAVANGECDRALVRAGNEAVLRARYEDAAFFFAADLAVPPAALRGRLGALTFEERLGSMAGRADRINEIAAALAERVELTADDRAVLARAGELAKFDLAAQMVIEMPGLAGFMAREYALRAGEPAAVADALAEMEQPRTATSALPVTPAGGLLSLADRFDLLMAMFALGAKPTGSSDPFGLRRAALGVVRVLRDTPLFAGITVEAGLRSAAASLRARGVDVPDPAIAEALDFAVGRLAQQLRDDGVPAPLVAAVMPGASAPGTAMAHLVAVRKLLDDAAFRALVVALQRIDRIVPDATPAGFDPDRLVEPSELALIRTLDGVASRGGDGVAAYLAAAAALVEPINGFFDDVLVMAEDPGLRAARLGLLAAVRATAPAYLDWQALHAAIADSG
jgi:glycyl-tRNA synthetase